MATQRSRVRMKAAVVGQGPLRPGDVVTFNVTIFTNRPIEIWLLKATFWSKGKSTRIDPYGEAYTARDPLDQSPPDTMFNRVDLDLDPSHPYASRGITVWPSAAGEREPAFTRQYQLTIPSSNVPDSWSHHGRMFRARVNNYIAVRLSYYCPADQDPPPPALRKSKKKELEANANVLVKNSNVVLERFGTHGPRDRLAEKSIGLPGYRGLVRAMLRVRDQLVIQGNDVPLIVHVRNESNLTVSLSLTLYKEYTFKDNDGFPVSTEKEKLMRVFLPPVHAHGLWERKIAGFTAPRDCMNSASLLGCNFVDLRFFVRLKVKSVVGGAVKCDVPVHLGTWCADTVRLPRSPAPVYTLPANAAANAAAAAASSFFRSRANTW